MLIINCIYKTNKYYISMFVIINHTLLKINFYIVITFLNDENKKNFDWVIVLIKTLYTLLNIKNFEIIIIS